MWEQAKHWMSTATVWDWVWHILAVGLVLVCSVPQIWWPLVEKYIIKKKQQKPDTSEHQSRDS